MLASPGHSPRHILSPRSPSVSVRSVDSERAVALASTYRRYGMRPPLPKKRQVAPTTIDEDTYVAAVEKIIERDFFPDIPKLQNRLEWLEAVRSGDPVVIREAQLNIFQRRREKEQQRESSAGFTGELFSTPSSFISGTLSPSPSVKLSPVPSQIFSVSGPIGVSPASISDKIAAVDTSLSLDDFLRRYTSEDNASFKKILEKTNKQKRQRYQYLTEKELLLSNLSITQGTENATDGYGTSGQPNSTLDTWAYQAKNLLMYDSADRSDARLTEQEKEERVEGAPKGISITNTRFHGKIFDSKIREEDTVAILYTPVPGSTPSVWPFAERDAERARKRYDLEDLRKTPLPAGDRDIGELPKHLVKHGGYSFVATPSPAPGVDESPIMTWGEIEGTPLRLEAEETPVGIGGNGDGPHFKIPAPPTRDARAHTLSRDAARSLREKSRLHRLSLSPSPARGSDSPAIRSLSAAAQKFVNKAIAKSCSAVDARLRASYSASTTPGTPRITREAVRSREGSVICRESSVPLRSPSLIREPSITVHSPSKSPVHV